MKAWPAAREGQERRDVAGPGYRVGDRAEPRPLVLPPYQGAGGRVRRARPQLSRAGRRRSRPPDGAVHPTAGKDLPSLGVAGALRAGGFAPAEVSAGRRRVLRVRDPLDPARSPQRGVEAAISGRC